MNEKQRTTILTLSIPLLVLLIACSFSVDLGNPTADTNVTPVALNQPVESNPQQEAAIEDQPQLPQVVHTITPGEPGGAEQSKDDIDSSITADEHYALGDSFRLGNFERPFTNTLMEYRPETDLLLIDLTSDEDFYYFTFSLIDKDAELGYPSAYYGIEFDTDYDGRGDFLLWAPGDANTQWNTDGVMLLLDGNDDVGGTNPVVPDGHKGNGYDRVLFARDVQDDPDAAWKRLDPYSSSAIQLAVKVSLIDNNRFYWKAWSDKSIMDPTKFDYNDWYSESQAGSPNKNSTDYPVAMLNQMDSTCWAAYKLEPTGTELGGCVVKQEPQCNCVNVTALSQACCSQCGLVWDAKGGFCKIK